MPGTLDKNGHENHFNTRSEATNLMKWDCVCFLVMFYAYGLLHVEEAFRRLLRSIFCHELIVSGASR